MSQEVHKKRQNIPKFKFWNVSGGVHKNGRGIMEHNNSRSCNRCGVADIKDPKREWELAPFRDALEKFVNSEDLIAKVSVNLQHIISGQPITPLLKSSEHRTHLIQLYEANKALKTEENNENKRGCPGSNSMNEVQTQTIPTKADDDVCSRKSSGGDDYDEESFLSYDSNSNSIPALDTSERPHSLVHFLSPQNDENPPPHDGACPSSQNEEGNLADENSEEGNLADENSLGDCAIAAKLDVPPQQFLQQNQKGCAWVFCLNEKAACVDTSQSNQRGVTDSADSEEYDSSFISDDV